MKLTKAEYRLLDALNDRAWSAHVPYEVVRSDFDTAVSMIKKGLLSKRAWDKGSAVATAAGRRSYSRGVR